MVSGSRNEGHGVDVEFGPYLLKGQQRLLMGPEGPVELSDRSFDILVLLLNKPNELVGKAEIFDAVWPGIVVGENTLQVHISALRKALNPALIVTVHGRGYKYAGPPPVPSESVPAAVHQPIIDGKPVIVLLPFENLSGDPEQQYFSDGIAGDITDRLVRFRRFVVIGQHSARALRGATADLAVIRDKLKADFVVTGSVRRSGDRIRIASRLSSAQSDEAIWAERYDRPIADLFDLQDEISELIASAIARHLEIEINVRSSGRSHASLSSYEHLLQGYWHFRKLTRASDKAARQCFEKAVALDPGNANAVAWLGATYCEDWVQDFTNESAIKGAALAAEAVSLNPLSPNCHAIQTWALVCIGDLDAALRASERAVILNAGDPAVLANRALALAYDGRHAEAQQILGQARRLEPLPPPWFAEYAAILAFAKGRYAETLIGVEPIMEAAWDNMYALACYGHLGLAERAREMRAYLQNQGRNFDWRLGSSREPYRDGDVRERLIAGLNMALSF
jgi:TolB-like protein